MKVNRKSRPSDQKEERIFNNSSASLNSSVIPDEDRVAKYDPYYQANNKGVTAKGILLLIFLLGTVYFLFTREWLFAGIAFALLAVAVWVIGSQDEEVSVEVAYRYGLLIPAVIVQENPLEIVALADIGASDGKEQFACKRMAVGHLDPHMIRVNEKVPCVAMFKCVRDGMWSNFKPRAVAWATSDIRVIQDDISAIDSADWAFLMSVKKKYP